MTDETQATNDAPNLTDNGIDVGDDYQRVNDLMREAHGAPLVETETLILFRDASGYELNEFAKDMDADRRELSQKLHELARTVYDGDGDGDPWSVTDPVVLAK